VPFAERSLEVVVDLYHKTACHKAVISEKVLQNIIKVFSARMLSMLRRILYIFFMGLRGLFA